MKIALTNPHCWPYVRRGGERFLHDLSHYLATRGHEVTVFTAKPGAPETVLDDNVRIVRAREIKRDALKLAGITPTTTFIVPCFRFLRENEFDVVHCLHYADGVAAAYAQRVTGTPYIVHILGMPVGRWVRRCPWETYFMKVSLRRAARVVTLSKAGAEALRVEYGRTPDELLPVPCHLEEFEVRSGRDLNAPIILTVADFAQRRKGATLLLRAFVRLKQMVPNAILQYSGNCPERLRAQLRASIPQRIVKDVHFLGVGQCEELPGIYGRAAVTVLPSVQEIFGMVLVESLACGTPVVGSTDAGMTDIVEDDVGVLFDPGRSRHEPANEQGLTAAILSALRLYDTPGLNARCRRSAERFGWERLGPRLEQIYYEATGLRKDPALQSCLREA